MTTYLPHILAGVASFAAVTLWTLWKIAQHEVEKLSDQLTKAAEFDKLHRATIAEREQAIIDAKEELRLINTSYEGRKAEIADLRATLSRVAFFRNEKGQLVRPDGKGADSKKSRQREKRKADKSRELADTFLAVSRGEMANPFEQKAEPKPLTRAEACLAILHEAKDAGFEWAQVAIDNFSEELVETASGWDSLPPLTRAVGSFNYWTLVNKDLIPWLDVAFSESVRNFKPKTQWPA